MFQVEVVWNREFHFQPYGVPLGTLDQAIEFTKQLENMGDGASVKKTRVVTSNGTVVYEYGKRTNV